MCSMRDMPGIMSQMPPLPVTIDEDLADSILTDTSKVSLMKMKIHILCLSSCTVCVCVCMSDFCG